LTRETFWIDGERHDTIGMAATDGAGKVAAGCSTTNSCTSMFIVQQMAQGAHPQQACNDCIKFIARTAPHINDGEYCVIAINPKGEIEAGSMNAKKPLQYGLSRNGSATRRTARAYITA
jgi:isoaspartyl peptidase/L-asparaginase-like protein (Ntn-hydrolase superfamily)